MSYLEDYFRKIDISAKVELPEEFEDAVDKVTENSFLKLRLNIKRRDLPDQEIFLYCYDNRYYASLNEEELDLGCHDYGFALKVYSVYQGFLKKYNKFRELQPKLFLHNSEINITTLVLPKE